MAASDDQSEEKTEKATAHKLKKAREKGNIATSKDMIGIVGFVLCILYLMFAMPSVVESLIAPIHVATDAIADPSAALFIEVASGVLTGMLLVIVPILILTVLGSIAAAILVNKGFVFALEKIKPDVKKLDPVKNAKEKFKRRNISEFAKTLIKILAILIICLSTYYLFAEDILLASVCSLSCGLDALAFIIKVAVIAVLLFLILVAILDLRLQDALFMHDQRMTKTELKREYKELEGDPLIKSNRRQISLQALSQSAQSALESTVAVLADFPNDIAVGVWHPGSRDGGRKGVVTLACSGDAAVEFIATARSVGIAVINVPELALQLRGSLPMQPIVSDEINDVLHQKLRTFGLVD